MGRVVARAGIVVALVVAAMPAARAGAAAVVVPVPVVDHVSVVDPREGDAIGVLPPREIPRGPSLEEPGEATGRPEPEPRPDLPPAPDDPSATGGFSAIGDNNTTIPPDTMGAVGPSHLMTILNSQYSVQSRTGATLLGPNTLASFFSGIADGPFDPRVFYDQMSSRWIAVAVSDRRSASARVLLATSTTSNPTGTWCRRWVDADGADADWADFPTLGFNANWIAVAANMFTHAGASNGVKLWTWPRQSAYASCSSLSPSLFSLGTSVGFTLQPAVTQDPSMQTLYVANHSNGGAGRLRFHSITGTASAPVFNANLATPISPVAWSHQPVDGADFLPQAGTSALIQANDSRLQNLVYRNEALWGVQTVFYPAGGSPTRASVQWWKLSTAGAVLDRGVIDDPGGAVHYTFPSIAVNADGDVAIGFSRHSATTYASTAWSFRYGSDPPGTTRAVQVARTGLGPYHKTFGSMRNRWGDYSATVVDPADDTTFWTLQEYAAAAVGSGDGSGRWGTWWTKIASNAAPVFGVAPTSHAFGSVFVGSMSSSVTLVASNTGTAAMDVSAVQVAGSHPGDFPLVANACIGSLAPGASCTVGVSFAPTSPGARSASLRFTHSAPGSPLSVPLTGTGESDTTPPATTFTTTDGSVLVRGLSQVRGSTVDAVSGVSQVQVTMSGSPAGFQSPIAACGGVASCAWSVTVPLSALPGVYTVTARGSDVAGNVESPGPTITVLVV